MQNDSIESKEQPFESNIQISSFIDPNYLQFSLIKLQTTHQS